MKQTSYKQPKLTVVGAGPGDPSLITLKAVQALAGADVVLYDALVNKSLLDHAGKDALKIYVGKRDRRHTYTQEQIHSLIVDLALTHGHVVRLKGGDPFVFGRGQEEIEFAEAFNIETAYIPGISSSVGVPGLAGIPVTLRGVSESFWVITGTTRKNQLSEDVYKAAQTHATVVILMGLGKLHEIVSVFRGFGKESLPAAVIQNGSLPGEKIALGTVGTIESEVKLAGVGAPAIVVIGEAAGRHPLLREKVPARKEQQRPSPINKVILQPLSLN